MLLIISQWYNKQDPLYKRNILRILYVFYKFCRIILFITKLTFQENLIYRRELLWYNKQDFLKRKTTMKKRKKISRKLVYL